jgi:hypothetical protein
MKRSIASRLLALGVVLALVLAVAASAADARRKPPKHPAAVAAAAAKPPPFPRLRGTWSHAEINVTIKRVPHTLVLDRGRVTEAASDHVTLLEGDGSTVTIPLTAATLISVDKAQSTPAGLQPRMNVEAMRIDGGAAVRIDARSPKR